MDLHEMLTREIAENERLRTRQDRARCQLLELMHRSGGPAWLEAVKLLKPDLGSILTDLSR